MMHQGGPNIISRKKFFPNMYHLNLIIKNCQTYKFRDILQNNWPVLF